MTANEMWNKFCESKNISLPICESWQFGDDADHLANLVLTGEKSATSSAYELYGIEGEDLPQIGEYNIILYSNGQAACITKTTNVYISKFNEISARHAFLEGEGDKSLPYWNEVHERFFSSELTQYDISFNNDILVVCEEFEVVYK